MEGEANEMGYSGKVESYSTGDAYGGARDVLELYPSGSYEVSFTASISAEEIVEELEEDESIDFLEQDTLFAVVK